jgi:hypothetical protein
MLKMSYLVITALVIALTTSIVINPLLESSPPVCTFSTKIVDSRNMAEDLNSCMSDDNQREIKENLEKASEIYAKLVNATVMFKFEQCNCEKRNQYSWVSCVQKYANFKVTSNNTVHHFKYPSKCVMRTSKFV